MTLKGLFDSVSRPSSQWMSPLLEPAAASATLFTSCWCVLKPGISATATVWVLYWKWQDYGPTDRDTDQALTGEEGCR
jgi:hypothetical protein